MFDFNDALLRGLEAAKSAQANRDEIQGVFTQLNESLHSMSEGKVEIAIVPIESTMDDLSRLVVLLDSSKSEQVLAVRLVGNKQVKAKKIARWKQGDAGYPCTIMWGERHASCDSADSLRTELAELVSSPSVGEIIFNAMRFQPPVPQP